MTGGAKRFEGRTAIITGASRGIGLGIAQRIVDEGGRVCLTARNDEALQEAVVHLGGPEVAIGVPGKADDPAHQEEAVARTLEVFGSLDHLVNNTGINPVYGRMIDLDLAAAQKMFAVNVLSALSWTQRAYAAWMETHGGTVVNVASVAGTKPAPGIGFYGATKAMLIHITQELAVELGPQLRVNAVAPAVVKTRFASALYEGREDEVASAYPMKRLGVPADIASVVAFLLSDDSGWLTGQNIVVDGGLTLTGGV
ncbi:SDR family oxidoreductase [Mumia sp. zg.B53]|uniref:SDR family oxidoreductase n=1 Tax=unclassified Mumia TaxID=2621872 RepID=UPI001C6EB2E1|nr:MULTISPECIES: SDR family oxidoreductase [unclassified Mumia]MBW9205707.1 SDR family oxidoreductase [Mumia sp. zg.B17]MBW9208292.1 SDR family oxidoreductase [Mumia sp. zg.B21]MBW9216249.1 SDR family oxidoreductase [Mumia sp. zg.B53]MDD9348759.1 SDR family oxidoreductase [Mumia sp.]